MLHENSYWQCFCGFISFQKAKILDESSLTKFRNRLGAEGMKYIEEVFIKTWTDMGLVKTKRVSVDSTAQPKNIKYPTDAGLLNRIREKIVNKVIEVIEIIRVPKSFRTFTRIGKKLFIGEVKFARNNKEAMEQTVLKLTETIEKVVEQAKKVVKSLYNHGHKEACRKLNQLVSLGKKVISQTKDVLARIKPKKRIYSLHESEIAAIKKGKSNPFLNLERLW